MYFICYICACILPKGYIKKHCTQQLQNTHVFKVHETFVEIDQIDNGS